MLRAGSLPLAIETGRHRRPETVPLQQRLCKLCHSGEIEDEFHFVMSCRLYDDLRDTMFESFLKSDIGFCDFDEHAKFLYIMQHANYLTLNCILRCIRGGPFSVFNSYSINAICLILAGYYTECNCFSDQRLLFYYSIIM